MLIYCFIFFLINLIIKIGIIITNNQKEIINGSQESVEGSELTTILLDIGNEAQTMIGKQSNISSSFFIVNLLLFFSLLFHHRISRVEVRSSFFLFFFLIGLLL